MKASLPFAGNIGFLGTGLMGEPMAARLLQLGCPLRVWNRSRARLAALQVAGAEVAESPVEVAERSDVVFIMFDKASTTRQMLFESGVAAALKSGSVVIDMSSNDPATARYCAGLLEKLGVVHLDAPVSGGVVGAQAGTLAIMVGGAAEQFARIEAVFEPLGRACLVGPSGSGQLAKLANQIIVAVTIGAVSEALLFASAGGADPAAVREALTGGFADSPVLRVHGERMIHHTFEPGGSIENQVKDLDAVEAVASAGHLALPLASQVRLAFSELLSDGHGRRDHSALALWLEQLNGITI